MSMKVFNGVELIHAGCNLFRGCGRRTKPELSQGHESRYIDRHLLRQPVDLQKLTDLFGCRDNDKLQLHRGKTELWASGWLSGKKRVNANKKETSVIFLYLIFD